MSLAATDDLARLGLTDGGPMATTHVRMAPAEASTLAARWWGRGGEAERLPAEKDDTFRIRTDGGPTFVLKVAAPTEELEDLEFETELMRHVLASGSRIAVPEPLPARDGRRLVPVVDAAGQRRILRLITLIPGRPLDSTSATPIERERVGEALAHLRAATGGFHHAGEDRVCAWDVQHLASLAPLLAYVSDREQRLALEQGLARFADVVAPRLATVRFQLLHNDFSRSNIIVDHARPEFVTGVIDFGDAVRTAVAIDVATALLNQLPRRPAEIVDGDLFAQGRDLLRGYLRHADLTVTELALLPHLVTARVVARALLTTYRARLMPDNAPYVLRNTEQGWHQLRWLSERGSDELSTSFAAR